MPIQKGESGNEPEKKEKLNPPAEPKTDKLAEQEKMKELDDKIKKFEELSAKLEKQLSQTQQTQAAGAGIQSNDILALAKAIQGQRDAASIDFEEGIFAEQMPVDDILPREEWVTFCAPKAGYALVDDNRNGMTIKLPYGKKVIFFEYVTTNRTQNGKDNITVPLSTYTCKSLIERDWIRQHSMYGSLIFESTTQAASADALRAVRMAQILSVVKDYDQPKLIVEARRYGVEFTGNVEVTRLNLVERMLEKEAQAQEANQKRILEETFIARELMNGKGN